MKIKLLPADFFDIRKSSFSGFIAICIFSVLSFTASAQTGKALNFDGVDDYVTLPVTLTGSYTKEVYINTNTLSAFPNILSGSGTALFLNNGQLSGGHSPSFNQVLDPTPLSVGTWYHVAISYDAGTGTLSLYKDGVLVSSAAAPSYTEPFLNIGNFSNANNFNGSIDEVRIWNYALTAIQIQASMNCELTGDEPNLLAYYNFNQGTAGGTNTTETMLLDRADHCLTLNGSLQNFALTGATSNWVAPGPVLSGTCANLFSNISVTGNSNCITTPDLTPSTTDFTDFGGFGAVPVTRTFIIQNTGNTQLIISSVTITGPNPTDFISGTSPTIIAAGASAPLQITFNPSGSNGVRNAVVTINNSDLDEGTFTFAITGNVTGSGQTLNFDGINDYVITPVTLSGSYTKEAYINTNSLTAFPNIISGTGTAIFLNNGQLAAGNAPGFNTVLDPTPLVAGTWYHVAVTFNSGTGAMNLYKDGVLVSSGIAPSYTETTLNIGEYNGGNYFNGNIDELRIWNVERSAAQIAANINCPLSGSEAGLNAYYNFNQGAAGADNSSITKLNDLHGDCPQNGMLQNFALNGPTSNWIAPGAPLPGTCTAQVPNISVAGLSNCIITGDASPSISDNTDYGTTNIGMNVDHVFYIRNNGGADLTITSITLAGTDASSFTVLNFTPVTLVPGDSIAITVSFSPTTTGIKNATVIVNNNDADESSYNFAVTGTALGPLPVTLLYFRALPAGKVVSLNWETSLELNNAGFELQRSVDGNNSWQRIGYVAATNQSNGSRYSFTDAAPVKGTNAYRLKQIDLNGRSSFSRIELVNFTADNMSISIYPNPVQDKVSIVTNDSKLLNTQAKISNASGAVVGTIIISNLRQEINLSFLSKGIYFIRFSNGTVQRIVKM